MFQGLIGRKVKLLTVCACMLCIVFLPLSMAVPANAQSDPLARWSWRSPLPQGNPLRGVSYGNNTFVAVGDAGTVISSPDGVTWTSRNSGTSNLQGVSYGNNTFVAVGDGTVLQSGSLTGGSGGGLSGFLRRIWSLLLTLMGKLKIF
jgi:hypothetical protein